MGRQNYVCGFLFKGHQVLLVEKKNPEWQRGLLNGIGGKVENYETSDAAMTREFEEETGLRVTDFELFATEHNTQTSCVYFYRARVPVVHDWISPSKNDASEPLYWIDASKLGAYTAVGNLSWLIPLALDRRKLNCVNVISPIDDIKDRPTW